MAKRILRPIVKTVAGLAAVVFLFDNHPSGTAGLILLAATARVDDEDGGVSFTLGCVLYGPSIFDRRWREWFRLVSQEPAECFFEFSSFGRVGALRS
jgi:hypothetical protein